MLKKCSYWLCILSLYWMMSSSSTNSLQMSLCLGVRKNNLVRSQEAITQHVYQKRISQSKFMLYTFQSTIMRGPNQAPKALAANWKMGCHGVEHSSGPDDQYYNWIVEMILKIAWSTQTRYCGNYGPNLSAFRIPTNLSQGKVETLPGWEAIGRLPGVRRSTP